MNIIEVANQLKDGKKIRRKDWDDIYLKNDLLVCSRGKNCIATDRFEFDLDDILATDWEVIE
jgi:hypothetical protein